MPGSGLNTEERMINKSLALSRSMAKQQRQKKGAEGGRG